MHPRTILITAIIALLSLTTLSANPGLIVSVDAGPQCIPADGKSYARVLVSVMDQTGAPISDSTEIRLTTTAGDITPAIYTTAGRATGILTSSDCPQTATIIAMVNGAAGSAQVEFSATDKTTSSSRAIRITGGSLAYCADSDTLMASDGVTIEYKGLTIRSTNAQVCQMLGVIRAQGQVSVSRGDDTIETDAITLDLRSDRLRVLDSGDESCVRAFDSNLRLTDTLPAQSGEYDFAPLQSADGKTWIVSRRLVIFPGERILFFKTAIYVGDSKVIKMPYYSYSYETRESILQQVRYTSSEGMLVDLPVYYQMADSGTGALKLRYAASGNDFGGYFRPRKGLSLGIEQAYSIDDRSQGRLFVDAITDEGRTFELAHHIEYGSGQAGGRADISARYQPNSSYAKGIYNATVNLTGGLGNYDYQLSGYFGGSSVMQVNYLDPENPDYMGQSDCSIRTTFRPRAPITMGKARLTPSFTTGYGSLSTSDFGRTSTCLYQSLGLNYSINQPRLTKTSLSFDSTAALTATAEGDTGASLRAGPTLRTRWDTGSASVSYTMNLRTGTTDGVSSLSRHQLGATVFLRGTSAWNATTTASYGLDSGRLSLYSTGAFRVADRWQVRANYNIYRYKTTFSSRTYTSESTYLKTGLYRTIGPFEIGLAWSPNGQNYGLQKDKRLWLEFGSAGF